MTKEQQVAIDAMRSAWPEETVARWLFVESLSTAEGRATFDEAVFEHWREHGHASIGNAALTVLGLPCLHAFADELPTRCSKCGETFLSSAEAPAGASAPRPQGEPRQLESNHPDAGIWGARHRCSEPASDCWCRNAPGAGAG